MRSRVLVLATASLVFTLALPVHFVAQTLLADEMGAATHTAALALGALLLVTVVTGIPRRDELRELGRNGAVRVALAGFLGVFAAQYLVLANRFTDAPPGSEVIFFTTAAWGLIVVVAGLLSRTERPSALQLIAACIALVGAAAILGNWERPSSFSPFVRYPREHVMMLLAGGAWAAFTLLVAPLGRRFKWRVMLPPLVAAGALVSLVAALASPTRGEILSGLASTWPQLIVAASSFAAILITWCWLVAMTDVTRPAALFFLPAVSLTILGVFERRAALMGPSPLLWDVVWWACVVTAVGALGVAALSRKALSPKAAHPGPAARADGHAPTGARRALVLVAIVAGGLAVAAGVAALVSPALTAQVVGSRTNGAAYEAAWRIPGAETVGAVLAALAALGALAAASGLARLRWRNAMMVPVAAGLLLVLLSVPALATTPLRTWTRWIPAEVQQDYGTEYARLTLEPTTDAALTTAVVLAGTSVLALAGAALVGGAARRGATSDSDTSQLRLPEPEDDA